MIVWRYFQDYSMFSKFRNHLNNSTSFKILLKKWFEFYLCHDFGKTMKFLSLYEDYNHVYHDS